MILCGQMLLSKAVCGSTKANVVRVGLWVVRQVTTGESLTFSAMWARHSSVTIRTEGVKGRWRKGKTKVSLA